MSWCLRVAQVKLQAVLFSGSADSCLLEPGFITGKTNTEPAGDVFERRGGVIGVELKQGQRAL